MSLPSQFDTSLNTGSLTAEHKLDRPVTVLEACGQQANPLQLMTKAKAQPAENSVSPDIWMKRLQNNSTEGKGDKDNYTPTRNKPNKHKLNSHWFPPSITAGLQ